MIGIAGAFSGFMIVYVIPFAIYLKITKTKKRDVKHDTSNVSGPSLEGNLSVIPESN